MEIEKTEEFIEIFNKVGAYFLEITPTIKI
jgi:hypothetical protein